MLGKSTEKTKMKAFAYLVLFLLLLSFMLPGGVAVADNSRMQPISDLNVGDRVVDTSWTWQFGSDGENKPVVWRVVAKNHYGGIGSHVTLVTDELISAQPFNNGNSNHWGSSSLRTWLNNSFSNAMSVTFRNAILTTPLPNKNTGGDPYTTSDKVFLPSQSELGGGKHATHEIGENWGYFTNDRRRIATIGGKIFNYWTRSPSANSGGQVRCVAQGGNFVVRDAGFANVGVRPAVNLSSEFPISIGPRVNGIYELVHVEAGPHIEPADVAGPPAPADPQEKSPSAGSHMLPFMITGVIFIILGSGFTFLSLFKYSENNIQN